MLPVGTERSSRCHRGPPTPKKVSDCNSFALCCKDWVTLVLARYIVHSCDRIGMVPLFVVVSTGADGMEVFADKPQFCFHVFVSFSWHRGLQCFTHRSDRRQTSSSFRASPKIGFAKNTSQQNNITKGPVGQLCLILHYPRLHA